VDPAPAPAVAINEGAVSSVKAIHTHRRAVPYFDIDRIVLAEESKPLVDLKALFKKAANAAANFARRPKIA
jgi:hypothetical protein